ncbi:MAG: hypothetical protein K1X95_00260 [Acidimicrobiia bacterium]|nr:hypothetical protein [Acidimicrobiia bacterium]
MKNLLSLLLSLPTFLRRVKFVYRAKLMARLMRVDLDIHVDRRVKIGRNVLLKLEAGNPVTVHIGPNVVIEDDVRFEVRNNIGHDPTLWIEGNAIIHPNATMIFGGHLVLKGMNEIGYGTVIRCSQYIEWGSPSGTGEYVSVYDFLHATDQAQTTMYQSVLISQPVKIGNWVMLAAKSVVNPGSTISDMTIVAPNSVVSGNHGDPLEILAGIPAKHLFKPEMWPLLDNPFIAAVTSWIGDKPGAGFKTVEEAKKTTPDPGRYRMDQHGWDAIVNMGKERVGEKVEEGAEIARTKAD